jgi:hypothetical protein
MKRLKWQASKSTRYVLHSCVTLVLLLPSYLDKMYISNGNLKEMLHTQKGVGFTRSPFLHHIKTTNKCIYTRQRISS